MTIKPESPASTFLRLSKIDKPNAEETMIIGSCILSLDCAELCITNAEEDEEDYLIEYICGVCGDKFNEIDLVTIQYTEYSGASMQETYVSPCCHADWDYEE